MNLLGRADLVYDLNKKGFRFSSYPVSEFAKREPKKGDVVADGLISGQIVGEGNIKAGKNSLPAWKIKKSNGDIDYIIKEQVTAHILKEDFPGNKALSSKEKLLQKLLIAPTSLIHPITRNSLIKNVMESGLGTSAAEIVIQNKIPMPKDKFMELAKRERAYAFTVADVTDTNTIERLKNSFQTSFESGETFAQFKTRFQEIEQSTGLTPRAPHQIETIFRTNSSSAYSQGLYEETNDPDVADFVWGYRYLTVGGKSGDGRNRLNHLAMAGFVARKDAPVWKRWWTPNGFNERCSIQTISRFEADRNGWLNQMYPVGNPPNVEPDEGFRDVKFVNQEAIV